jgi:hypothetical protein
MHALHRAKQLCAAFGFAAVLVSGLAGCSSGNGGSNPPAPAPVPAPSALSYPTPPTLTRGTAMATLNPTVTGTVTTYSVSPALPAGIAINAGSGAISGTPTAVAAAANYTVTAANATGSTTFAVAITVNDTAPAFTYPQTSYTFTMGVAIANITPASTGGAAVTWAVDPALPAGLSLNTTSGVISGTPTVATVATNYQVTATNTGGSTDVDVSITIAPNTQVLADLGHVNGVLDLELNAQRMISADAEGRVILWNSQSGERLYEAKLCPSCDPGVALAGDIAVIRHDGAFTLLSQSDGAVRATIQVDNAFVWWRLATDGSYFVAGSDTALNIWSPTGALLSTRAGNYRNVQAFAAPGEIRVALGPSGAQVIEKIAPGNGAVTLTPTFQGTFRTWFADGGRFLSNAATNVWVYSSEAVQEQLLTVPTVTGLAGTGNRFWTGEPTLSLYTVGGSATPDATFDVGFNYRTVVSGNLLTILRQHTTIAQFIDLSVTAPTAVDVTMPGSASAFAANSATDWAIATGNGVIWGETPATGSAQLFSLGSMVDFVGNANRLAYTTYAGRIYIRDSALAPQGEIEFAAQNLQLSDNGNLLLADTANDTTDPRQMRFYELPSRMLLLTRIHPGTPWLVHASMSGSGTVVAELLNTGISGGGFNQIYERRLTDFADSPIFSDTVAADLTASGYRASMLMLSPDGVHHAALSGTPDPNVGTSIRSGSTLVGAAPGIPNVWIDNNTLLIDRLVYERFGTVGYLQSDIVNLAGQVQTTLNLRGVGPLQALPGNRVYSRLLNRVYSLANGAVVWSTTTPHAGAGAVVGNNVVFMSGNRIVVEAL